MKDTLELERLRIENGMLQQRVDLLEEESPVHFRFLSASLGLFKLCTVLIVQILINEAPIGLCQNQ